MAVAISPKAWGEEFDLFSLREEPSRALFAEEGSYAVVQIVGPLTQHEGWWGDDYDDIRKRVAAALESSAPAVCLRIDSPGGDYTGCLELARDLRAMAAAAEKPLVAFTDGSALSAAYAIACSAAKIVATPSANVGSIGVWAPMVDMTARDSAMGIKWAIAASGVAKSDRNPHLPITEEAYARLKAQVELQAVLFFELVAEARSLSVEEVRALDGAEVFGRRADVAGLIDLQVNSWSAFLAEKDLLMPAPAAIKPGAAKASKYDEAYGLLKQAAEGEDEEAAKKAKKCLKAMEDGDKDEKGGEKEKAEAEAKKKAEAEEMEKKKDEEEKAKALAANNLALAHEVQTLKAKEADRARLELARADADKRVAILAKRPDLGPAALSALRYVPTDKLEEEVGKFARVTALPGAAAAAMTPEVTGGERLSSMRPARALSPQEQEVFDRTSPFARRMHVPRAAMIGNEFTMPARILTHAEAAARVAELEKEIGNL